MPKQSKKSTKRNKKRRCSSCTKKYTFLCNDQAKILADQGCGDHLEQDRIGKAPIRTIREGYNPQLEDKIISSFKKEIKTIDQENFTIKDVVVRLNFYGNIVILVSAIKIKDREEFYSQFDKEVSIFNRNQEIKYKIRMVEA